MSPPGVGPCGQALGRDVAPSFDPYSYNPKFASSWTMIGQVAHGNTATNYPRNGPKRRECKHSELLTRKPGLKKTAL